MTNKFLANKAKKIREKILDMAFESQSAHISSSLSITDILVVLYWSAMKSFPKNPNSKKRDVFILSKGHASSALYAVLAEKGYFSKKLLKTYNKNGTIFGDHPIYGIPGVELATGSLGHGLSVAAGMALNEKISLSNKKIFVLVSDAECQEGTVWEAILFAGHNKLKNLILIVDFNKLQALGRVEKISNLNPLKEKINSFGWRVYDINGHDIEGLKKTLNTKLTDKPTAIICNTIGGKGVSFMENDWEWHYKNIDKKMYQLAVKEIKNK
jgi:transketolase